MKNWLVKIAVFFLILGINSCSTIKGISEEELLLRKNTVLLNGTKVNDPEISGLLVQKPNNLNRLRIYNLARQNPDSFYNTRLQEQLKELNAWERMISRKQLLQASEYRKGFHKWLMKTGEAPVIIDSAKARRSADRLKRYYDTQGYFNNKTSYSIDTTKMKDRRGALVYEVQSGRPYFLDTLSTNIPSKQLDSLYTRYSNRSKIKKGQRFILENFNAERERLTDLFVNSGIYRFQPSDISFDILADTLKASDDYYMPVKINIGHPSEFDSTETNYYKVHRIRNVNIYADYAPGKTTDSLQVKNFDGYNIYYPGKLDYKPKALTDAIAVIPGDIYREADRNLTSRQIGNLRTFKYPNINYVYADSTMSVLDANIYLTPRPKFSLGFNTDVSHSNIQDIGISFSTSLTSRNVFRGAETLELALRGTIGSSTEFNSVKDNFFNISEFGGDIRLKFPRLLLPFDTSRRIPKSMAPETLLSAGTTFQKNIGLDKQSLNGILRYSWNPTFNIKKTVELLNIQYIRNLNPDRYYFVYRNSYEDLNALGTKYRASGSDTYYDPNNNLIIPQGTSGFTSDVLNQAITTSNEDFLEVNRLEERRDRLTANNFIFSANYSYSRNNRSGFQDNSFYQIRTKIESAGNLLDALSTVINFEKDANGNDLIFGVQYSQYIKGEFDYVKYWEVGRTNVLAFHSFFGLAVPYGNASNIPFLRRYFAGGSNDNRAWEAYSLGPGRTDNLNDFNEANMKLALNLEYRFDLVGSLKGAFFADAGNIWNIWDDVTTPEAIFDGLEDLKDTALGTGLGLRYDFSFFVFRFDVGFKTYNPANEEGERWFKDFDFGSAVYNIGINYPF